MSKVSGAFKFAMAMNTNRKPPETLPRIRGRLSFCPAASTDIVRQKQKTYRFPERQWYKVVPTTPKPARLTSATYSFALTLIARSPGKRAHVPYP
jgi:hypothetical protein